MSSVDPYQPIERLDLTLAERHKPKLVVQTRSPDDIRDCDLFQPLRIVSQHDGDHGRRRRSQDV